MPRWNRDDDYAFADRLGAKYGGVDLRNMDRPGERRTVVDDQPDPGASRRHAPARQRRFIAEALTAVDYEPAVAFRVAWSGASGGAHDDVVQLDRPACAVDEGADVGFSGDDVPSGGVEVDGDARDGDRRLLGRVVSVALIPVPGVSVLRGVRRVQVSDDQQGAAGCHPVGDALVEGQLRHRGVRVVGGDQVEPRARFPGTQVRLDPPHALGSVHHPLSRARRLGRGPRWRCPLR